VYIARKNRDADHVLSGGFHKDVVALFRSGLEITPDFKAEYLGKLGTDRIESAIAAEDATFEKIRLRNMATSRYALRSKTLEANDLESVVGPAGASRFVPQRYSLRNQGAYYTATPNTGRITLRSDRSSHDELIRRTIPSWCFSR
jgi:hypothetical protein